MSDTTARPPTATPRLTGPGILQGTALIAGLELKQRLRSRTLLVLAIVWFAVIGVVTVLAWLAISANASAYDENPDAFPLFSLIVYFVLLFGTLVAPAISANAINSERAGATLATTQVTLVRSWSIVLGKVLAAWVTGIAFLVVALPFVLFSLALGRWDISSLVWAILALALQIGVFTAIGVGLSALISSPLFSIVTGYLVVAAFSIGTLIAFGLGMGIGTSYVEVETQQPTAEYWDELDACQQEAGSDGSAQSCAETVPLQCEMQTYTTPYVPGDKLWWLLAANPYVVVADSVPMRIDKWGGPSDLFGMISVSVRSLQLSDSSTAGDPQDHCVPGGGGGESFGALTTDPYDPLDGTIPVWWMGLGVELLVAAGLLLAGERRVRTPAAKLSRGTRIA